MIEIEDACEVTCTIKISDSGEARIFATRFDLKTKTWVQTELTDFLPIDEAVRIQALAKSEREKYFYKLGKTKKLWR